MFVMLVLYTSKNVPYGALILLSIPTTSPSISQPPSRMGPHIDSCRHWNRLRGLAAVMLAGLRERPIHGVRDMQTREDDGG